MKGTDFYQLYKQLEACEKEELTAAVKAHGGEYIFFDCDSENANDEWFEGEYDDICPIILASLKYDDIFSDFYVTRITLKDGKWLTIYGFRKEFGWPSDERKLDVFAYGQIHYITETIPETDDVKDVTMPLEVTPNIEYRPFKNRLECLEELHKHGSWIQNADTYFQICQIDNIGIVTIDSFMSYTEALSCITFLDNTPFGIKINT